jgi:3-oxoacyl-[acyl-carrier-protein] synthase-1
MWLLRTLPNNVLCHVGIRHALKGPNGCITHHTTGGILALGEAAQSIRDGEATRAVAVGHDTPIEPQMMLYYHRCGLIAERMIRPFDAGHDGSLLGEGAAAVALETAEFARERGASVMGEYLGAGNAAEGEGLLALRPDGDGAVRAMRAALDDAGVAAGDLGMIVAHGNGTPQSDASEAAALRTLFGARMPPVTGFKWVTGHPLAASGILDVTLGLAAARKGVVPGIRELARLAPECDGINASAATRELERDLVLVLCRGFGGTNVAVVMRAVR